MCFLQPEEDSRWRTKIWRSYCRGNRRFTTRRRRSSSTTNGEDSEEVQVGEIPIWTGKIHWKELSDATGWIGDRESGTLYPGEADHGQHRKKSEEAALLTLHRGGDFEFTSKRWGPLMAC